MWTVQAGPPCWLQHPWDMQLWWNDSCSGDATWITLMLKVGQC